MKTFLFSLVALFIAGTAAQAQDFSYGIIGGYNLAKVNNFGSDELEDRVDGYHIGAIAEFKKTDRLSFEAAIYYSEEGEEFTDEAGNDSRLDLRFINIPVHFKYYVFKGISVHAGPQVGILLRSTFRNEQLGGAQDVMGDVGSSFAATAGLGYDVQSGSLKGLFIKGTVAWGITDLFDNVEFSNDERSRVGHVSIGYKF